MRKENKLLYKYTLMLMRRGCGCIFVVPWLSCTAAWDGNNHVSVYTSTMSKDDQNHSRAVFFVCFRYFCALSYSVSFLNIYMIKWTVIVLTCLCITAFMHLVGDTFIFNEKLFICFCFCFCFFNTSRVVTVQFFFSLYRYINIMFLLFFFKLCSFAFLLYSV